jgi:hypothetical protein
VAMLETLVVRDPLVDLARLEGVVSAMAAPTGAPLAAAFGEVRATRGVLRRLARGHGGVSTLVGHPETANVDSTLVNTRLSKPTFT